MKMLSALCALLLVLNGTAVAAGASPLTCEARGKLPDPRLLDAACTALSRHLSGVQPTSEPLRLVLTRADTKGLAGHVAAADGGDPGPAIAVDAQDGPLAPADIDHFARSALALFLSR